MKEICDPENLICSYSRKRVARRSSNFITGKNLFLFSIKLFIYRKKKNFLFLLLNSCSLNCFIDFTDCLCGVSHTTIL